MKRIASIVLLVLFLFNNIGYYGVYLYMRSKAEGGLRERLDADNFNQSETITFKVPLAIPYQSDWSGFQRVDGEFEKDGKFYNLVKQKIQNDTLIVVAVRDHEEASLFESLVGFVHLNTDNPLSKKTGKMIENFTKDYLHCFSELTTCNIGWSVERSFVITDDSLLTAFSTINAPPPRG